MKQWSKFLVIASLRVRGVADPILAIDKGLKTPSDKVQITVEKRDRKAGGNCVPCTVKDHQPGSWYPCGSNGPSANLTAASCHKARYPSPGAGPLPTVAAFTTVHLNSFPRCNGTANAS